MCSETIRRWLALTESRTATAPRRPPTLSWSPWPSSRRRLPSSAPAGTRTATCVGRRAKPAPLQQVQGTVDASRPRPQQAGQHITASLAASGAAPCCCNRLTISRRPRHMRHSGAWLPGCAPLPAHCRHSPSRSSVRLRWAPSSASLKSRCSSAGTSFGTASSPLGPPLLPGPLLPPLLSLVLLVLRASSYSRRCRSSERTLKAREMACRGARGGGAGWMASQQHCAGGGNGGTSS